MKTITITDRAEMEAIIQRCPYCTVGLTDREGRPYLFPMNFAYHEGTLYLHSGEEGTKVALATLHPETCISFCDGHELVYMHRQMACSYSMKSRSVICRGRIRFIDDATEKRRALELFMRHYTDNECGFSEAALRAVRIWAIRVEEMTARSFGLRPSEC